MPNPPRKRFPLFPIKWHLSTAIVMMFVAGALIWLNSTERINGLAVYYGWPDVIYISLPTASSYNAINQIIYKSVIITVVIAGHSLPLASSIYAWLIPRRAARRGASSLTSPPPRKRFPLFMVKWHLS